MSHPVNPPLSNMQRGFVVLLLLLGTVIAFGVVRFMNPEGAFTPQAGHVSRSAAANQSSQRSARP
jgi:hypothetical protein